MTGAHVSAAVPCSLQPFVLFSDPGVFDNGWLWDMGFFVSREIPTCVDLEGCKIPLVRSVTEPVQANKGWHPPT